MQKLFTYILSIISFLAVASCGSDEPESTTTAAKTIFVFMPYTGSGDSNLYSALNQNLNDMEKSIKANGGMSGCQLVAFIARPDGRNGHLVKFRYKNGNCYRDTVKTYTSKVAYITTEGRTRLLQEVKSIAPAMQYAMIVGCHGEGWIPVSGTSKNTTRFIGGSTADYQINIVDFAQSIADAGMKMQFILFDDCYMSGIEVAYDLKDVTDKLIASTSEMMAYGMPYHKLLRYLMADTPDYAALAHDFIEFYKDYDMPYGTIGVTYCSQVEAMAEFMRSANATHTFDNADEPTLQDLDAGHFTPTVYYDFASYVRRLCANDEAALSTYEALLEKLVPYSECTDYIYSFQGRKTIAVKEFCGLTISDPSTNNIAVNTKKQTAWWKATH